MRNWLVLLTLVGLIALGLFLYISQPNKNNKQEAINLCIQLCQNSNLNLTNGPCLSDDNPQWNINDWVCDVAHWPRQSVDNLAENQCKDFREGKANHFVEVDENCELIRAI